MYGGVIAISPQVPRYRLPTSRALADSCLETMKFVQSRFSLLQSSLPTRIEYEYWHPNETRRDGPGWR